MYIRGIFFPPRFRNASVGTEGKLPWKNGRPEKRGTKKSDLGTRRGEHRLCVYLCNFLSGAGFFTLDFLQAVRGNKSRRLDLLWREFFASAHTGTANKTQYVPMSIMRVFWGMALTPELSALYHKIRTIPSGDSLGSGVGWDMAIEMLNAAIKAHVLHQVSHTQISQFLSNWALLECVQERLRDYVYGGRPNVVRASHAADATHDVNKLKAAFKKIIGATWAEAIKPNTNRHVTKGHAHRKPPWREMAEMMRRADADAPHLVIRRHVTGLTPFFNWAP